MNCYYMYEKILGSGENHYILIIHVKFNYINYLSFDNLL